jgi:hypothetical protein
MFVANVGFQNDDVFSTELTDASARLGPVFRVHTSASILVLMSSIAGKHFFYIYVYWRNAIAMDAVSSASMMSDAAIDCHGSALSNTRPGSCTSCAKAKSRCVQPRRNGKCER